MATAKLILTRKQAQAFHTAMCLLNLQGMRLAASIGDRRVEQLPSYIVVTHQTNPFRYEQYDDQQAFAHTYLD